MSVLEKMRSGTESTWMQVILALVLVSFVGWYGAPTGDKAGIVARVNGTPLTANDLARAYRNLENQRSAALGRPLTEAEEQQVREDARQQLIQEEVLLQEARALGLEVSKTEIAQSLLSIDLFRNEQGAFDKQIYANTLRRMGFTQADFEAEQHDALLIAKLQRIVMQGASVSEAELRDAFTRAETAVDVAYVRVTPIRFNDDVNLDDAAVNTFATENAADIEAAYQADFARLYNQPERLRLRMIRLAVLQDGVAAADLVARLAAIRKEAEGGADLADLARKWSEHASAADGGDLGDLAATELDADATAALKDVQPGALSSVIVGADQVRLYKVEARTPAREIPLDEVRTDIARKLLRDREAPKLAKAYAEKLLAAWKETGAPPQDLLDAQELTVESTGLVPVARGAGLRGPPEDVMRAAAAAASGAVLPQTYEQNGTLWVAQVKERREPDMNLFETEKATIREHVLLAKRAAFYEGWVQSRVARADVE